MLLPRLRRSYRISHPCRGALDRLPTLRRHHRPLCPGRYATTGLDPASTPYFSSSGALVIAHSASSLGQRVPPASCSSTCTCSGDRGLSPADACRGLSCQPAVQLDRLDPRCCVRFPGPGRWSDVLEQCPTRKN